MTTLADKLEALVKAAFDAGATTVHNAWINDLGQREPDFGEAASDYAKNCDFDAILRALKTRYEQ